METVKVSGLKKNPSEALLKSQQGVVVVLHPDKPDALIVGIELAGVPDGKVRQACAGRSPRRQIPQDPLEKALSV